MNRLLLTILGAFLIVMTIACEDNETNNEEILAESGSIYSSIDVW